MNDVNRLSVWGKNSEEREGTKFPARPKACSQAIWEVTSSFCAPKGIIKVLDISIKSSYMRGPSLPRRRFRGARFSSSSETQGQIVGTRESLNGRKNVARRKVKSGEKSSSRRSLLFFVTCRSLLFFVPYIFFRPFRLSLAPTICPWVSEDCFTSVGPGTGISAH